MAIIGTLTKQANGSYMGSLATLNVKTKISFNKVEKANEKAPSFRITAGNVEVGAAWISINKDKNEYLSAKFDDPSFPAPVFCRLVKSTDGDSYLLVWSRSNEK